MHMRLISQYIVVSCSAYKTASRKHFLRYTSVTLRVTFVMKEVPTRTGYTDRNLQVPVIVPGYRVHTEHRYR